MNELGEYLFTPIHFAIDKASEIEFIISEDLIQFPFDILYYKAVPLFLHKPVLYSFGIQNEQPFPVSTDWVGFMISDVTADPERGVLIVKELFPNSQYFDIHELTVKSIKELNKIDLLLISAHGVVTSEESDYIALKNEKIHPHVFSHLSNLKMLSANN